MSCSLGSIKTVTCICAWIVSYHSSLGRSETPSRNPNVILPQILHIGTAGAENNYHTNYGMKKLLRNILNKYDYTEIQKISPKLAMPNLFQ